MKTLKLFLIAIISAGIVSCSNDDDAPDTCYVSENENFDSVTGPESTTVNVPVTLNATITITNSCGEFIEFIETDEFPKEIVARVDYTGCTCADVLETVTIPYTFEASQPGEYELKFVSDNGFFISKVITVTQ